MKTTMEPIKPFTNLTEAEQQYAAGFETDPMRFIYALLCNWLPDNACGGAIAHVTAKAHALALLDEIDRLRALLNTPEVHDFSKAIALEALHQRERWGQSDVRKCDADWFWLIGYLAGKSLHNPDGDTEKRLHRIITIAAAACNWHAAVAAGTERRR